MIEGTPAVALIVNFSYRCLRPPASCELAELTLVVSPLRTPVRLTPCPASSPNCDWLPASSYFLSPSTSMYLEPLRTHILAHSDALRSESVCRAPQCASVINPEKAWPGTAGSTC